MTPEQKQTTIIMCGAIGAIIGFSITCFILPYLKRRKVVPGSVWAIEDKNPFNRITITVLEVRDGWVKYQYNCGTTSSTSMSSFVLVYNEIKNAR